MTLNSREIHRDHGQPPQTGIQRVRRRLRRVCRVLVGCAALIAGVSAHAFDVPASTTPVQAKAFRDPDLYIRNVYRSPADLPPQAANTAQARLTDLGIAPEQARVDVRSGRFGTLTPGHPLIPGRGLGNNLDWSNLGSTPPQDRAGIGARARAALDDYLVRRLAQLDIDNGELASPGQVTVSQGGDLVQIHAQRIIDGVPVRDSYVNAVIKHGNLVLLGARNWGDVTVSTRPTLPEQAARAALAAYLEPLTGSGEWGKAELVLVPTARGQNLAQVPLGQGLRYRLAWIIRPEFAEDTGRWEGLVDAHSGHLISFEDTAHYATPRNVVGGVYPVSNDGAGADGTEQAGWPMPFSQVTSGWNELLTDAGGNLLQCVDGNISSALDGLYVRINDNCGAIDLSSAGDIDFGTSGGTDCTTPGFGGAGNTHSARSGFHELNRIMQMARGQLPDNPWLQQELTANMNIDDTCNAFYDYADVNFFKSGGGCANTGEIAAVFDHEWGHGMDDHDATPGVSNPGEGIADLYAALRLNTSCIGRNFRLGANCTGFGDACTQCDGVRDIDWANHASGLPHDIAWADAACGSGSGTPCGGSTHCEGHVYSEAVWDLWKRDLTGVDANTAHEIVTRLTYTGAGGVGSWFQCDNDSQPFGGCGADGGYLNYLAADDDDGNLNNGTPHMSAIYAAFNRHGIACDTPAVVDSGCSGAPATAPVVSATAADRGALLSWSSVPNADHYQVFRTDGVHGCGFGKIKVGETTDTSFFDGGLQNGRDYSYIVMPVGTSEACLGPASACTALVPAAGPNLALDMISLPAVADTTGDGDALLDNCETATIGFDVLNVGSVALNNVRIVAAEPLSHPGVAITTPFPQAVSAAAGLCGVMNGSLDVVTSGLANGDTLEIRVDLTSDELYPRTISHTLQIQAVETDSFAAPVFTFESGLDGWEVVQGTFDRTNSGGGAQGSTYYMASSADLADQCDQVRSPLLRLAPDSTLSMYTQFDIEGYYNPTKSWWDRANVGIVDESTGVRTPVNPDGGRLYNASGVNGTCGTANQDGWADTENSWAASTWSAGALGSPGIAGDLVRLDLRYGTDPVFQGYGLHFDQVTLTNAEVLVADAQTDVCDASIDGDADGVLDAIDNCPLDANPGQEDFESDGMGDICDDDDDNDGVDDVDDPFPMDASEWADTDHDGIGDNSDPDIDGDGLPNDYETANGLDPLDGTDCPPWICGAGSWRYTTQPPGP